ncbi:hypothetical protein C0J52_23646 [Blattella germanica]|nr:hypothetical protein C0J52_23646 [Blattella germanica]
MALKKKPPGDVRTIRTPRNIQGHRDWESRRICAENMNAVQENFPGHVFSQRGNLRWSARSPYLSACDYSISFGAILTGKFMPTNHVILKN